MLKFDCAAPPPAGQAAVAPADAGPWNPGVRSFIPRHLVAQASIHRPENVFTSFAEIAELRDLTGLEAAELVVFRPQRLVLHELLIRVTGDFSVPDGSHYEDLGINFRAMTGAILSRYLEPHMAELVAAYDGQRRHLAKLIDNALEGGGDPQRADEWEAQAAAGTEPEQAVRRALARVVRALFGRHGSTWGSTELIARLAIGLACNSYASSEIGRRIEPYLKEAAQREGYRLLPAQERPIVMNTKGPSASGKSTLRPLQRALARRVGVEWNEFALISPDIWRKQLLDYASLGADYRYAAMLTSDELAIVDRKLDRYMEGKAAAGAMPHMLIDRFRFGSFAAEAERAGRLLSRFGHRIYFFFMLTPPRALVERAWTRGLEVGRYKAIDDVLAHGVEAYAGMPRLFLSWAEQEEKPVHYEFLDNSVRLGTLPRTAAFGWNGSMVVLDVACLLDIARFRRVNVEATQPEELYPSVGDAAAADPEFLVQCVRRLAEVRFAEYGSGRVYLELRRGVPVWSDGEALGRALADPATRRGLLAVAPGLVQDGSGAAAAPRYLRELLPAERISTLGDWGNGA